MEEVKTVKTVRDEDCPRCGWGETVTIRLEDMTPLMFQCNRKPKSCGWQQKIRKQQKGGK